MDNLYKKEKKGISTMQFLLLIIVGLLGFYTYTSTVKHKEKVRRSYVKVTFYLEFVNELELLSCTRDILALFH